MTPQLGLIDILTNYTFRSMLVGTGIIGAVAGMLGCFLYLKKQTMISDVIGHSSIAGIALGFIVCTTVLGVDGRSMWALVIASIIISFLAVLLTNLIAHVSRLGVDAAMAVTLALFFGGGMLLIQAITRSKIPGRSGIEKYMFGNAATMTADDIRTIAVCAALAVIIVVVFFKEFTITTFDPTLAKTLGFSPAITQPLMLITVTTGIVIGVKAVGLILMIGFVVMPAAAARQWTTRLRPMIGLAAVLGAGSGVMGSVLAVSLGKVPTGPIIIVVLAVILSVSLFFSPQRSPIARWWQQRHIKEVSA